MIWNLHSGTKSAGWLRHCGRLKDKRIPLLACAYHAIRTSFNEKEDDFKGYEDLEEED
jgi:hypothetical protein